MHECIVPSISTPYHHHHRNHQKTLIQTLLPKCSNLHHFKQLHAQLLKYNLHQETQLLLLNSLLRLETNSNAKKTNSSSYAYATLLYEQSEFPIIPTFTYNLMIRLHTLNKNSFKAILVYNELITRGKVGLDKFTFPFVIKACLMHSALFRKGKEVHAVSIKTGFYKYNVHLHNVLMDFYFDHNDVASGREVFKNIRGKTVVSWTSFVNGLINVGELVEAKDAFELMPVKNVVSYTAMINGYVRNNMVEQAFLFFRRMLIDNVTPNEYTLVSLLKACTEWGSLTLGRYIHEFAMKNGVRVNVYLGTSLIDMYSKCGSLYEAKEVFCTMEDKTSVATWNAMITSLGIHNRGEEVLALFVEMESKNVKPDGITFVGVLNACVKLGSIEEGFSYLRYMSDRYGIVPSVDHYACVVALLSRGGMLDEAYEFIKGMKVEPNEEIWGVLLRASRLHDYAELEEVASRKILELDSGDNVQLFDWEVG